MFEKSEMLGRWVPVRGSFARLRNRMVAITTLALAMSAGRAGATPFAYVNAPPNVKVVDLATDTVVATAATGSDFGPSRYVVSPDGSRVYMHVNQAFIRVLDTATNTVTSPIDPGPVVVNSLAIHPNGTRLYISAGAAGYVRVVDTATFATITDIVVANNATTMALNPSGTRLYVPNLNGASVVVIDTATNTVLTTITGTPGAMQAAVNPAGTKLYVGSTVNGVHVVDTATNTVSTTITGPVNSTYGVGLTINPAGTRLYAASWNTTRMYVIDTATDSVITSTILGDGCSGNSTPNGVSVNPSGTRVYFTGNGGCGGLRIFDTTTNTTVGVVAIPGTNDATFGSFIGPFCPAGCSDGNPCTTDSCNPVGGCVYTNNTGPCATDGIDCTDDVCDGAGSCTHPNSTAGTTCSDGAFCDGPDTCDGAGACTNHAGDPCTGGAECAQTCNEATDDCFDPNSTACSSDGNVCTDDHCSGSGACIHTNNIASCDDGLFCNGADNCSGGTCTHGGDPCTGGPECADACNETADNCFDSSGTACGADPNPCTLDQCDGAGACAHPAGNAGAVCRPSADQCDATETCTGVSTTCPADGDVPNGTTCNDGNPCTSGEACTAGACGGGTPNPAGCIDHYFCYKTKSTQTFSALTATLTDQFETASVIVQKPKGLCAPANKNAEGVLDDVTHEESYPLKQTTSHVPQTDLVVTDQFGTLHVDTLKPDRLLVPTNKGLGTLPPLPLAGVADHYKCYKMKIRAGTPRFPKGVQATVEDQFQTRLYDIKKPRLLCNPVDKNGEGIEHALAHLLCYQVKPAKGQPKHVRVVGQIMTRNQFGPGGLDTIKEDVLCVPATKTP